MRRLFSDLPTIAVALVDSVDFTIEHLNTLMLYIRHLLDGRPSYGPPYFDSLILAKRNVLFYSVAQLFPYHRLCLINVDGQR